MKKNNNTALSTWELIRQFIIAVVIFAILVAIFSRCSTINKICVHDKTVPVVFITKLGVSHTFNIPYCDTIKLNCNVINTTRAERINKHLSRLLNN